ncbi:MAG TPA: zinc-ribbon domain-containing protein [Pyrinomonadaceae bacterium]|nr:zinc-ribbon domain-containing protein [Pyrinomonadaceae bacterium]
MEPEIARRCTACGLSVRQRAVFCPQCGNPIPEAAATTTVATVADTIVDPAPTKPLAKRPRHQDGVKARVEKLRHVSSVMLDQAAYDPSLRFLLVAAAFFILFLVLLIISKVIG